MATVITLLVLAGYWLGKAGYWLPYSFDVALFSLVFYFMGYIIKKFNITEIIFKDPRYGIMFSLIWLFGIHQKLVLELATRYYPGILTCVIISISGTFVFFYFCYFISNIKALKNILVFYGQGTIFIFCIHHLEWVLIPYNKMNLISNNYELFLCKLIIISTIYLLLFIIKKNLKFRY